LRELQADKEAFLERLMEEFSLHAFLKAAGPSTAQLVAQARASVSMLREHVNAFIDEQSRHLLVSDSTDGKSFDLVMLPTEFNYNPASNAPAYIASLFQAASALKILPALCSALEQRLGAELFQLADADMRSLHQRFHRERSTTNRKSDVTELLVLLGPSVSARDRREIEAFGPFLGTFLETLLVKMVIILSVFSRARQDHQDVECMAELYAYAVRAVHTEIRNVMGSFLKGPTALTSTAPTTAATFNNAVLFKLPVTKTPIPSNSASDVLTPRERANARKQARMLAVDSYAAAQDEYGHGAVVRASLHYLPLMFPPHALFTDCLKELNGPDDDQKTDVSVSTEDLDVILLQRFLMDEYLPFLESQASQELTMAFQPLEALLPETNPLSVHGEPVPRCVKSFSAIYNLLMRLGERVPVHAGGFERLLRTLCESFIGRMDLLLASLGRSAEKGPSSSTASSHTDDHSGSVFFAMRAAADPAIRALLKTHPLLPSTSPFPTEAEPAYILAEKEALLLDAFKKGRSLVKAEIIWDRRLLAHSCLLQRGLALLLPLKSDIDAESSRLLLSSDSVMSAETSTAMEAFFKAVEERALGLLIALRLELRSHLLYSTELALREGTHLFHFPNDGEDTSSHDAILIQPDTYITALCGQLLSMDAVLGSALPSRSHRFCLDGLATSMQAALISGFKYVRDINAGGYMKLQAGLRALEQLLTLILPSSDISSSSSTASLDRVRAYLALAQAGPDKLLEAARACAYRFAPDQYMALLDAWYRDQASFAGTGETDEMELDESAKARRREYQNMVVRLQYLN